MRGASIEHLLKP